MILVLAVALNFILNFASNFTGGNSARADSFAEPACTAPVQLNYEILHSISRSKIGFTQGLFFQEGLLFESVGEYGNSTDGQNVDPNWTQVLTAVEF